MDGEGLVPYCKQCAEHRFAPFATAVSLVVVNRSKNSVLLAKHKGDEEYILFAGYIKKGETAEKAVTREFKEETKLDVVKYKFMSSQYHEPKNVLMLNFLAVAENGEPQIDKNELDEVRWVSFDEALSLIKPDSLAEKFLKNAMPEIKKI